MVPTTVFAIPHTWPGLLVIALWEHGGAEKVEFQATKSAKDAGICPSFHRGPDAPGDQEHHHREYDADGKLRPNLAAKRERPKPEGSSKCYRATDGQRQTFDSREDSEKLTTT